MKGHLFSISPAASTMSREEVRRRYAIGTDTVMWGNDYPHPEGTWPTSQDVARDQFSDVSDDDLHAIVGGNAAKVFGFDLASLAEPVAV